MSRKKSAGFSCSSHLKPIEEVLHLNVELEVLIFTKQNLQWS